MLPAKRISFFLLRVAMGWLFFYAGITKITNASWSAAGYLTSAKTFHGFYAWLALPANIGWVHFLNEWGLTLIGACLILGFGTRIASSFGIVLMILYYFPQLDFPHVGANAYLVDEHIVYILSFILLTTFGAGRYWGIDAAIHRIFGTKRWVRKFCSG